MFKENKFIPEQEKIEKKDYITHYKDLEITEKGKGGEKFVYTEYIQEECSLRPEELKGIDVEDIVITDKNKKEEPVSFKKYLPEKARFASVEGNKKFKFAYESNSLVYSELGGKGDQLTLLHETRHAHQKDISISGRELISLERKLESGEKLKPDEIEKARKVFESVATDEREAWAWAIRELKKLRGNGIDLEPEIKNAKDINQVVIKSLKTYDKYNLRLIKEIFDKPIFWKTKEWVKEFEKLIN